jgi:hypothetical protein
LFQAFARACRSVKDSASTIIVAPTPISAV